MQQTKKISTIQNMAIFSLFLTSMGVAAVSPAMAKFATVFSDYDYVLISTMPTLTMIPVTLWTGAVAGKRVRYRTLSTVGIWLFLIGGILPFFLTEYFWGIIFCRAVFGIGIGLRASIGNALIMNYYTGKQRVNYLNYGTLVMNAGGIAFQMLGGILAGIQWNYTFLAYLLGLISLVLVFFLPEPIQETKSQPDTIRKKKPEKLPVIVFIISALFFLYNIMNYPAMMNMALLFADKQVGGASVAATALSLYTLGGCAIGFVSGKIFHHLGRFTIPLGYFMVAFGAFLLYVGETVFLMSLGSVLMGIAFSLLTPAAYSIMGNYISPEKSAVSISICMACLNLGGFFSTYWMKLLKLLFGEYLYSSLWIQIVGMALLGLLFLFVRPVPKQR